ncbi:MAG: DNA mismatch endonuclease Vsr [Gammaproteobacteria bacterium]|nr:DNA mismatch endonuclease Vsr [Gammaproteobacteria bacterium]
MADIVNPRKRSDMMSGIRAKNTKPELVIRQLLHQLGFRYRLHRTDLPGKPDIVLPKWKTVVFVHGCFWHGHIDCPLFRPPKSRTEFWAKKIAANQRRDGIVIAALSSKDWQIIEVWECALKGRRRLEQDALSRLLSESIRKGQKGLVTIRGLNSVEP